MRSYKSMFEHKKIQDLNDFFVELNNRRDKCVYFYRINSYNERIHDFILKYYELARVSGVIIEGPIPNPDDKNLSYYNEIMGMAFQLSVGFIYASLKKWLPRMNDYQRSNVATSIYDSLDAMRKDGKTENMLKNAYIKLMCWLYYKFERIVNALGENKVPKILYEGDVKKYELMLLSILCGAGCDVVLLQAGGDGSYLKLDPESILSDSLNIPDSAAFPVNFNLKGIREEIAERINNERLYGSKPKLTSCTNAWITGDVLSDIKTDARSRGSDPNLFYNCFIRVNGVGDKLTYVNELYQFWQEIKKSGRKTLVLENAITPPTVDEIASIRRGNYSRQDQMLASLSANIRYAVNQELQRLMTKAFIDVTLQAAKKPDMNLHKLTNKAVYLLCWLKRYEAVFSNWQTGDAALCIYLGGCKNENEALFMKLLSRLPVDVLILVPNLTAKCCLQDEFLYEVNYADSLEINQFPQENAKVRVGTAAYHAERELDAIMYQDSGLYRNRQYAKASAVTLQTMYEEIAILWDQELKYRPSFGVVDNVVTLPVIFAKVSGVKDGRVIDYWQSIKQLLTSDTFVIKSAPFLSQTDANPVKPHATEFFKNGRLQRSKIKSHPSYQYGYLREDTQEYLLDKLQTLIDRKIIKGTFENGTEYTIVSTALNLNKDILRLIQKFDFTKKNPKAVYINTTERTLSLEDSILTAYLNLIGFDILFFIPTGYQTVEKYYNIRLMEEHQIGEYVYDLTVPDFASVSAGVYRSWRDKIFKRGT